MVWGLGLGGWELVLGVEVEGVGVWGLECGVGGLRCVFGVLSHTHQNRL